MLVGVRERGNDNFMVDFGALGNVCDNKSLDVEFNVVFRIGFDSFGGRGGRGADGIFSPYSYLGDATLLIGFIRGRGTEFMESFTKSFTD